MFHKVVTRFPTGVLLVDSCEANRVQMIEDSQSEKALARITAPLGFDVDGVLGLGPKPLSPLPLPQEAQWNKYSVEVTKLEARVSDRFKAKARTQ